MSLPKHLAQNHPLGLVQNEPIAQFEIGNEKNFVYLILDWKERVAAIVDPQRDLSQPIQALENNGFRLSAILLTHTHHDHIAGVPELARRYPLLPISVHPLDQHRLPEALRAAHPIRVIHDRLKFHVGSLEVEVLHTPGHSAGELCFHLAQTSPPYLLTGDTVFIRDCGRTDLASGSTEEMFSSLQRIGKLAPETVILPGHHYAMECASTIARELRESPPLKCSSVAELAALP